MAEEKLGFSSLHAPQADQKRSFWRPISALAWLLPWAAVFGVVFAGIRWGWRRKKWTKAANPFVGNPFAIGHYANQALSHNKPLIAENTQGLHSLD